jgi:hypothetical protein
MGCYLQFQFGTDGTIQSNTFEAGNINVLDSSADLISNDVGPSPVVNL